MLLHEYQSKSGSDSRNTHSEYNESLKRKYCRYLVCIGFVEFHIVIKLENCLSAIAQCSYRLYQ